MIQTEPFHHAVPVFKKRSRVDIKESRVGCNQILPVSDMDAVDVLEMLDTFLPHWGWEYVSGDEWTFGADAAHIDCDRQYIFIRDDLRAMAYNGKSRAQNRIKDALMQAFEFCIFGKTRSTVSSVPIGQKYIITRRLNAMPLAVCSEAFGV